MCGIAAAFAYAASAPVVAREQLREVRDFMASRGPDGRGEWFSPDGRVGLAHRRLAIIDLSPAGAQPMASPDGRLVISFNGEIYNYRELRERLQSEGRAFTSGSDTEVLLQLYEAHGTAMLTMLRGMFAFALWDARRGALLLARDTFGIKPLYYADHRGTLQVASQVKALLRADVDTGPEPAGHAGFFLWGCVPEPWTLYRGVRALPAGHFMWIDRQTGPTEPQSYCRITDILAKAQEEPAKGTRPEAVEAIAAALHASVRAHLVADVPVGLFLSGGVDSGIIASAANKAGVPTHALTLGFPEYAGTSDDERETARLIARTIGIRHDVCDVDRRAFESDRAHLLEAMDQPSIDGVNTWLIARAAASKGMKVALTGLGGDELLASYPSFRHVPLIQSLVRWPASVPGLGAVVRRVAAPLLRQWTSPKYAGLVEYGRTCAGAYLLRRALYMPWELPQLMDPDMARAGWEKLRQLARLDEDAATGAGGAGPRFAVTALEMGWYMRNQLLRDADWAGMAHSLEIRVPFVDAELLRAAAPWLAAFSDITKTEVAHAAAPELPREWLRRPKTGFRVPVPQWLGATTRPGRGLRPWARVVHDAACAAGQRAGIARRARVLVSTLVPAPGGVDAMTDFVVQVLARRGLEPVVAHYAPYSLTPALSVPSFRLLQRGVAWRTATAYGGHESNAIGAWLPELEFTHYAATRRWRELIRSCEAFVAVSGNVLAATPYWQSRRRYLAWVATDWEGDRKDRVKSFPVARRLLDRVVNGPVIRLLERRLLRAGHVLPLSEYTSRMLARAARAAAHGPVLPMAVDTELFAPAAAARVAGRIGFAGRFSDPRKNIGLLLDAIALLRRDGRAVSALVIGDTPGPELLRQASALGVDDCVEFVPTLARDALVSRVQSLDVFVVPSHQEGLCIAALEAMACGTPVVSTRCGGPEEFVLPGRTGELADATPEAVAEAIWRVIADRVRRDELGDNARRLVEERYSRAHVERLFWDSFITTFPAVAGSVAAHP